MARKIYRIKYRDPSPASPTFTWRCWAEDRDDALDQFWADGAMEGWDDAVIVSCVRERRRLPARRA